MVDAQDQVVWVPGLALHDAARVTADTKAVVVLTMFQVGRLRVNSTLKSLLFWMVLVVVGVLIWNFSTKFQAHDQAVSFSEFMS